MIQFNPLQTEGVVSAEEVRACLLRLSSGSNFMVNDPIGDCNRILLWLLVVFCLFVTIYLSVMVMHRIFSSSMVGVVAMAAIIGIMIIVYICSVDSNIANQCELRADEMDATIAQMNVEF